MGDDSRSSLVKSLKNEWSLLWGTLAGEETDGDAFEKGHVRVLSLDDVRQMTRELSQDRRKLNRRLESLQKEIELNTAKLESLRLVGAQSDEEPVVRKINDLSEEGQKIHQQLQELDEHLKRAREHEDRIRRPVTPA